MKNTIYITTMYRWGERDNHSYTIYVGSKKSKAIDAGVAEQEYRGGKYMAEVLEWIEDVSDRDTCKTIVELKRSPCIDPHGSEPVIILDAADWKRIEDAVVNLPEPNEKLVELFYGIKITRA